MLEKSQLRSAHFYGILDTGYVPIDKWLDKFDALVNGGARIVQVRAKRENLSERRRLLERVVRRSHEFDQTTRPIIIINDEVSLAIEFPGVGLHVGQDDTDPATAREMLGQDPIIGLSTHSVGQAKAAMELPEGVIDYFAVGPVFATQTKPDYTPVGLDLVEWVARRKPRIPFFCIGGINRENASKVRHAGGERIVAVSDILLADDSRTAIQEILRAGK